MCPESSAHLFLSCHITKGIWAWILSWIGPTINLTVEELTDFRLIIDKVKITNVRKKVIIIWIATNLSLWIMRNAMIFETVPFSFDVVCSSILFLSWRWLVSGKTMNQVSFYDWYKFPLACFITSYGCLL